jgi:hypothetical protein
MLTRERMYELLVRRGFAVTQAKANPQCNIFRKDDVKLYFWLTNSLGHPCEDWSLYTGAMEMDAYDYHPSYGRLVAHLDLLGFWS